MADHFTNETLYFKRPGPKNTTETLAAAVTRAKELAITKIVMPSSTGRTAQEALKHVDIEEIGLVMVASVTGFSQPNYQKLQPDMREELLRAGVQIVTAAHAFGSIGRGIRNKLDTYQIDEVMAYTLRLFGQGTKVGIEVALMAADAGLVRTDEDIISLGGTGAGVDTALVLQPSNTHTCMELKVREIIAKPWKI